MELIEVIEITTSMKKALLSILSLVLAASSLSAASLDLGSRTASAPYDRYMGSVKSVLSQLDGNAAGEMNKVRSLMREGRSFRYAHVTAYDAATPAQTAARRAGDCKDKALWLASKLNDSSVRFVIGKAKLGHAMSHAWLYWKDSNNRWWILDCTNKSEPVAADSVAKDAYVPLYSYAKGATFTHAMASGATSAVASR